MFPGWELLLLLMNYWKPLEDLEAEAAVMVGTLPEACLVVGVVYAAFGVAAPPPFASLVVDKMGADVGPGAQGLLE